ncbi:hypothetical protein C3486_09725 [Streptomyces sp. Ru73]|uniref:hypothetical protein n=1 Tax=Streptomyces sp. Ru73 TaxID=2080748 RepID=UPI000CDCF081|nr:hypothetical protein [Streptomyces sp. Ru73]POX41277.1 hypothetical protein C3486_09725 [Streptomyces sp. Ru73]
MAITDDIVKRVTDPTPLYALAGTADLASEKLKEVPALVERIRTEAPKRFEEVRTTDAKAVQDRVSKQAKEAQDKFYELLGSLDTDLKKIREQAQDLALRGVGQAAEYAVKAGDTYKELAERGQRAVQTWRGEVADEVEELAVAIEPEPEAKEEPKAGAVKSEPAKAAETKPAAAKAGTESKPASAPAAKKTAPAPAARKTTTAKKTTPPSK